jgi:hypothetical protein
LILVNRSQPNSTFQHHWNCCIVKIIIKTGESAHKYYGKFSSDLSWTNPLDRNLIQVKEKAMEPNQSRSLHIFHSGIDVTSWSYVKLQSTAAVMSLIVDSAELEDFPEKPRIYPEGNRGPNHRTPGQYQCAFLRMSNIRIRGRLADTARKNADYDLHIYAWMHAELIN